MPPRRRWRFEPETHEAICEVRRVIDGYANRVPIGEAYLQIEC